MLRKISLSYRIFGDLFWLLDHLFSRKRVDFLLGAVRLKLKARVIAEIKKEGPGRRHLIPRVKDLSYEDFRREYLHPCRPVILEGAAREWGCIKKWSPGFLSRTYGTDPVALIDASPEKAEDAKHDLQYTTLESVIESMGQGPLSKYSRFNTILKDHPELLADFDLDWLKKRRNFISSGKTFQVFIGGKGTKTHIHSDSEHNLFTQVYGKKHWILYPPEYDFLIEPTISHTPYFFTGFDPDHPDYKNFPAMEYADSLEGEIGPGDVLFVPPSWWHHVKNTEDSIGFGFRWFSLIDSFRVDFMMALLMMLATDPPIWIATQHREDFSKIFTYRQNKAKRK